MPKRINQLAIQFAQDGHLSFNQKCRSLVMQAFGHEALISTNDLVKNGHCPTLNTDTYRLKTIAWHHLAWRKLLNPFKWLEFILSWLEFLPWYFHHSLNQPSFLEYPTLILFRFLAIFLHLIIHSVLAIMRPLLAPVRHIIRPSIQLTKSHPLAFNLMLLMTLILTGLLAWFLLIGNGLWVIAGITLAGNFAAQLGIIALVAIILWTLALKCHTFVLRGLDIKKNMRVDVNIQLVEIYIEPKVSTTNMSRLFFGLDPEQTQITEAEKQGFCHSFSLFAGLEALLYPGSTKEAKKNFVHFEAQFFLKADNGLVTSTAEAKARNFLNCLIQNFRNLKEEEKNTDTGRNKINKHIEDLAQIIKLKLDDSESVENQRNTVINELMHKIQNIGDIMKIDKVIVLLSQDTFESNIEAAQIVMDNQPGMQLTQTFIS